MRYIKVTKCWMEGHWSEKEVLFQTTPLKVASVCQKNGTSVCYMLDKKGTNVSYMVDKRLLHGRQEGDKRLLHAGQEGDKLAIKYVQNTLMFSCTSRNEEQY